MKIMQGRTTDFRTRKNSPTNRKINTKILRTVVAVTVIIALSIRTKLSSFTHVPIEYRFA